MSTALAHNYTTVIKKLFSAIEYRTVRAQFEVRVTSISNRGQIKAACLDIPDGYDYMDPLLILLLENRVARHLPAR